MARPKPSATLDFRILSLAALILLALIVIGFRLWWVQVRLYAHYKAKIQGSSEVTVRVPSVRGEIRDRNGVGLPGVQVNIRPVRKYVYNAMAGQILGYVGAPKDINKLPDIKDFNFYQPDVQGRTNIEYFLDDELRGKPGRRILKKDAKNHIEGEKELIQPTPGANVYLTIDARIQYIVERTLRSVGRAASVVLDPNPHRGDQEFVQRLFLSVWKRGRNRCDR